MMSPEEEQEYRDRLKETLNIDIADE